MPNAIRFENLPIKNKLDVVAVDLEIHQLRQILWPPES